jgi:hypothetical protein
VSTYKFEPLPAKRLAVGDLFVPGDVLQEAVEHGYAWRVRSHEFTGRGDYSTFVESDGSDWSERFGPDEVVWLATEVER